MSRKSLNSVCRLINQVNTNLPVEQLFLSDLKRSIEIDGCKGQRKPSQSYKPSSMNCIRSMYYQMIGADVKADKSTYCLIGICNSGTDIHVRIQQAVEGMKDNNIDCEYIDVADYVKSRGLDYLDVVSKSGMETKLYHKNLHMSFLCDGIIRYRSHYYILELKTEMSMKWNRREDVDPSHYMQGTAYSIAFGLPEVLFVYVNRDILDMKAYMFKPTDDMKHELISKIEECDDCVARLSVPVKPADVTKKSCSYCGYVEQCRKDG